jgi:hypothetical protein
MNFEGGILVALFRMKQPESISSQPQEVALEISNLPSLNPLWNQIIYII